MFNGGKCYRVEVLIRKFSLLFFSPGKTKLLECNEVVYQLLLFWL
jgi:hypothetical protein